MRDVDAVLFDMDGTLVDSDAVVERVWLSFTAEFGLDAQALLAVAHGLPGAVTVRRFLPDLSDAQVARIAARQLVLETNDIVGVVPTVGALELLARLDSEGIPWGVVTSADSRLARTRLAAAGIDAPAVLVTTDDVRMPKPDPEGYLSAARRLGVDITRTLVVEDSAPGIAAGRAAGARVAALKGLVGETSIGSLTELTAMFEAAPRSAAL